METTVDKFKRQLRNLEGVWSRQDKGQTNGRNANATEGTVRRNMTRLAELARTDEVCDALDNDEKLAARWNRAERRFVGLSR